MSSVDIREVLKLQGRKKSLRQIANRLGLHHTTICRWVQMVILCCRVTDLVVGADAASLNLQMDLL